MHLTADRVILSPTDLVGYLACEHLTQLELSVMRGERDRPDRDDPELDLLARKGAAHEANYLNTLRAEGGTVVEIDGHGSSIEGLRRAEAETLAAMHAGADVIYQAAFFDGVWRGQADFLRRVATPSGLGDWSYEVADTKLARRVKVAALLQMCEYSHQVARLQGLTPRLMHVVLGDGRQETHRVSDYDAYHRAARLRLEQTVLGPPIDTYPDPVDHCRVCRWSDICVAKRRADDHLSLVAGMRRDHTRRLNQAGIATLAAFAAVPEIPVPNIGDATYARLLQQARLQLNERVSGSPSYELLPLEGLDLGLAALPPPSAGDLFFDMEGDPFAAEGGLEYLFGITEVVDGNPVFHAFWGHSRDEEKAAFEALIDLIIARLDGDPSLHLYHYAAYEELALKRLMGRHGTREDEVDRILRGGVLVDLYRVVRQGVRVSREKYSLKSLEIFYMPKRDDTIADAGASIVAYEEWLESGEEGLLQDIEAYNQRDCESTWRLRDWLERLRLELGAQTGSAVPRPEPGKAEPSESLALASAETRELVEALTVGVPADPRERDEREAARWLLAQLLDWHRREEKSSWWAYYARREMTDEELVEDTESIGAITHNGPVRTEKQSVVHSYSFDPAQEHKLGLDDQAIDPRTGMDAGKIVNLDNDKGVLELVRGPTKATLDHPTSLIPSTPYATQVLKAALSRVARSVIENGVDAPGKYRALRDLLMSRSPRLRGFDENHQLVRPNEDPVSACRRLAVDLDASCLAVQGPPGCGKTYGGAEMVVELIRQGRRVGVTAFTHRAIGNLLEEVARAASRRGQRVRMVQKCEPHQACGAPGVQVAASNPSVEAALTAGDVDVVAGTAWLFADSRFDGLLDVLVIDEAGQMSLANVIAAGSAAGSVILLGDPQQLSQPSQGIHPEGADCSALDYILAGHDTMPPERGVFLDSTRRMHPEVCAFVSDAFYERRLTSHPDCTHQRVDDGPHLTGAGTRLVPVHHGGNRTWSPEEVAVVGDIVDALLGGSWTDRHEVQRPLTLAEILVVAPYNAQVKRLTDHLPLGARVGTVDKFQGQEAAVTIYTMATSSIEDIPRNVEFLFSTNRLNVAVSRARALSIVVCSPRLLLVRCRTPSQLRLVNALCLYSEMAGSAPSDTSRPTGPGREAPVGAPDRGR